MLLEFIFENVLSYKDETYFSMETGPRLRKYNDSHTIKLKNHRFLKSSLTFGANASGKSNLLKAFNLLRSVILSPTPAAVSPLPYAPFLLVSGQSDKPSHFKIIIYVAGYIYRYSLSYSRLKIIHEKLEIEKNGVFTTYFERNGQNFNVPEHLKAYQNNIRENSLLLFLAQTMNDIHAGNVYKWFAQDLILVDKESINTEMFKLLDDDLNKKLFINFLQAADIQIEDIELRTEEGQVPAELRTILQQLSGNEIPQKLHSRQLYMIHKTYSENGTENGFQAIHFNAESDGTKKIVIIALTILLRRTESKVILIDEFDDSFHLELSKALLDVFNTKENINQFILTTHELQLMDHHLRKDQINFVEKKYNGSSNLFSLFDFDDEAFKRADISYMKRYLSGQFGASPIISLDSLIEMVQHTREDNVWQEEHPKEKN